jgi:hypothetical protein
VNSSVPIGKARCGNIKKSISLQRFRISHDEKIDFSEYKKGKAVPVADCGSP